MNVITVYQRDVAGEAERLTVMAYLGTGKEDGDEIRVIRAVNDSVVEDRIAFHGPGGQQWLRDHHEAWTAEGFRRANSASET